MENQKALKKVSDKDLRKVFLHSLAIMCSWNYERQMHMGFMYGMAPVLDKLYADDEERKKEAYQRHMEFFNCTPQLTPLSWASPLPWRSRTQIQKRVSSRPSRSP